MSSDPTVELKRITSMNSSAGLTSNSWQTPAVGDMNPTYQGINDQSNSVDPTTPANERMYDFVPGQDTNNSKAVEAQAAEVPAPPPGRRTTTNTIYEPSSGTLHPQTVHGRGYSNGEVETELEYDEEPSSNCFRTCFLSVLVFISLFLAIVAVVLVLLLWFNVIATTTSTADCPTVATSTGASTGGSSSSSSGSCTCEDLDVQPIIDMINKEAANLTIQIKQLSDDVSRYTAQNANLSFVTDSLDEAVTSVNSSCVSSLDAVTDQLGSIEQLNFEAQLLNVGVFNSCIYEYIHECSIGKTESECQTDYTSAIVPGYSNIDLACHIAVTEVESAVTYAPITNLRFNTTGVDQLTASPQEVLDNSMVRCECSAVGIADGATRSEVFVCKLYRARCLTTETYTTTIVT